MSITKKQSDKIHQMMKRINKSKDIIAKERDKLREVYYDLEGILESVTEGIDSLENGMRDFEDAVDKLSEQL